MITTLQCAQLCGQLYEQHTSWDHYWEGGQVVCALRKLPDHDVLIFQGSVSALDFLRDAEGWPTFDPEIGFCHHGFLVQMDEALAEAIPNLTQPAVVTGHSLGAARARIAAAKLSYRGMKVAQLCVFGSPRPGFANARRVIEKSGMAHESWRNMNDPVPLVPAILPWWEHTESWGTFQEHAPADNLDATRDHDIHLYIAGAQKLK